MRTLWILTAATVSASGCGHHSPRVTDASADSGRAEAVRLLASVRRSIQQPPSIATPRCAPVASLPPVTRPPRHTKRNRQAPGDVARLSRSSNALVLRARRTRATRSDDLLPRRRCAWRCAAGEAAVSGPVALAATARAGRSDRCSRTRAPRSGSTGGWSSRLEPATGEWQQAVSRSRFLEPRLANVDDASRAYARFFARVTASRGWLRAAAHPRHRRGVARSWCTGAARARWQRAAELLQSCAVDDSRACGALVSLARATRWLIGRDRAHARPDSATSVGAPIARY